MASILRQIVASPRARHPEARLDLCYVTDNIITTSGPSQTYPQRAYRNPLDRLVAFLDAKHGRDWAIWEFRAEGAGYSDEAVYGRVKHYPWPDHHPPPFRLLPLMMASIRNWLQWGDLSESGPTYRLTEPVRSSNNHQENASEMVALDTGRNNHRVAVFHCKAGKGRSGTVACSYLVSEEGWRAEDALAHFTQRRMRPNFGPGVSIPSQLRWVGYVERWARHGKIYSDFPVEITEVYVWGLQNGVTVDVKGFAEEGKIIYKFYTFREDEKNASSGGMLSGQELDYAAARLPESPALLSDGLVAHDRVDAETPRVQAAFQKISLSPDQSAGQPYTIRDTLPTEQSTPIIGRDSSDSSGFGSAAVVFKPNRPIQIPNSDINISVERRKKSHKSMGLELVTAVAHIWFNAFFNGDGPERGGRPLDSGVFSADWGEMDGIKGSSRKGTRALDRLTVVWRASINDGEMIN